MEQYITYAVAESRREEFVREAATARLARLARRSRKPDRQAQPRPAPQHHEVPRPVIA